jgi:thermitase
MIFKSKGIRNSLIAAATLGLFASTAMADDFIVKFKATGAAESAAFAKTIDGIQVTDSHGSANLIQISLPNNMHSMFVAEKIANLQARADVEYVTPTFKLHTMGLPNDPSLSQQWSVDKVNASAAWDINVGSRSVTVAVIDTGVNHSHEDLNANMWKNPGEVAGNGIDDDNNGFVDDVYGYDFKDSDADPDDVTSSKNPGHGTHCSGIIGAVGNNGKGISGMSQQVSLMGLRFIGPDGSGDLMGAIKSIDYAIAAKADVISASWGAAVSTSQAKPLIEAVVRASDAGIIFVAAAANEGKNNDSQDMYPANVQAANVITVAASDSSDAKPSWSNYGKDKVHVAAPGHNIYSTIPNNKYQNLSGTSMATPLVAGLVALLKSQSAAVNIDADGAALKAILQKTGAQVDIETACGCRVDAKAALDHLTSNTLTVVPSATTLAPSGTATIAAFGGAGGYTFTSSNPAAVEVTAQGAATAKGEGESIITVTDSAGTTATSMTYRVATGSGGGGGGGGGGTGDCPFDPQMCEIMCQLDPTMPWCSL